MRTLSDIRHLFLDMDGTIYHGGRLYPTTLPFLRFLANRKIGVTFLSNNSSYSTKQYVEKLRAMGIDAEPEQFYLSTDYTIDYLRKNHPEIRRIFLLGMACMHPAFEAAGFQFDEIEPDAVIVAFDRELVYERLCRAAWFLKQGAPGFATHPDRFCPTDQPTWLPRNRDRSPAQGAGQTRSRHVARCGRPEKHAAQSLPDGGGQARHRHCLRHCRRDPHLPDHRPRCGSHSRHGNPSRLPGQRPGGAPAALAAGGETATPLIPS